MNNNHVYDMLVVGGGPGGYTAALYAARAGLDTVVLEKLSAGGQMALTEQIDNYPGFENGIDGFSLAETIQELAERKETAEQQKQTAAAEEEASAKTTAGEQTDKGSAGSTAEKTEAESEENGGSTQAGYALQFGAFSSKAAAQSLSDALHEKGIDTKIVELDGVFKVLSPVSEGKTQALAALEKVKEKAVSEVFITEEPA